MKPMLGVVVFGLFLAVTDSRQSRGRGHRSRHPRDTPDLGLPSEPDPWERTKDSFEFSQESKLVRFLMRRYRRAGFITRPLINSTSAIRVEFSVALIQILDFDETDQVLTTNVWKRYRWTDELLRWNPDDYGGVSDIRLPGYAIWTPDIVLYNNADEQEKTHEELLVVYHTGLVRWIPPAIYKSSCTIDMRNFPFDEQSCHLKYGSWTYDGNKLELVFYDDLVDFDTREYIISSEWTILQTAAEHHVKFYPCCENEPYPDITFFLTIKRRTAFYIYVLILPSVLLSFLTLVLFWIPPQRPDRTSLGMSLFSSFFVLLLILVQSSPPTSASISLLGVYYCINMVLIAFSTMLSAVVINLTSQLHRKPVPRILRSACLTILARAFCAHTEVLVRDEHAHAPEEHTPFTAAANDSNVMRVNGKHSHSSNPVTMDTVRQRQADWRMVASVIDRLFFVIYVIGIILSLVFVFPSDFNRLQIV